uniref:Uncharacterized protein n=1 Tax=Zooxanthella nutricula TaxID=1333877 RepID=A0A7S2NR14_9DINO|mmetsp:Transcript_34163/g.103151  ORF Transcript_34163/g.103151 Transcript_34163/m.103151 type:complete len:151 (+) Transcript_34163:63-515(+)
MIKEPVSGYAKHVLGSLLGIKVAQKALQAQRALEELASTLKDHNIATIAEKLGCGAPAEKIDEDKVKRLLVRRTVYGDICQNESEEDVREILLAAGNRVPVAMKIMEVRAMVTQCLRPPAFFDGGVDKVVPEAVHIQKKQRTSENAVGGA